MWTLFLSLRYFLSKHHKEGMISLISLISILGVAVGVASLIVVISVMNGFDAEVKDKIIGTYAHVVVTKDDGISDPGKLASDMRKLPGVVNVSTFITGQAVLESGKSFSGVLVKGIDPKKEAEVSSIIDYTGGVGKELGPGTIILGSELMRSEGVSVGDMVVIIVPYTPKDIEKHELKVLGTFTSGRYDYDANIVVVSDETAREIFRMGDETTGIAIKVADSMKVGDLKTTLQNVLGSEYVVRTWMDLDRNLVAALALEKKMMFLILALIVMVACFNISGSLIMMVMEKTNDIGVLKAIGASSLGVSVVFILQGAFTGALGIITGVASGLFIANKVNYLADLIEKLTGMTVFPSDVYYFTEIPVKISSGDIYAIVAVTGILALSAGFYPAWKASRLDPVEAIRYE